jgi:hypothetical protein
MNKAIGLLPILLLLVPGFFISTELTARNFQLYYPMLGIVSVALAINMGMMVWHRKKQQQIRK